jgi:uncharacterized protein YndB with AHSA1/START domain
MNWTEQRKRKARRRLALRALAILAVGLGMLSLAGLGFGVEQTVSTQALLERPPETVWRVLMDLDGMPLWRSDLTTLERLPDLAGRPSWRETGPGGTRVLELVEADPPSRLVLRRAHDGVPALPMRTFELTAMTGGTRVTVTERARVASPLRRVLYRLHPPRAGLTRFLRDLDHRLSGVRREVAAGPR